MPAGSPSTCLSYLIAMKKIFVFNGPNLNLLGQREPGIYGHDTLASLEQQCRDQGSRLHIDVDCRQSNHEGQLVDWLQEAGREVAGGHALGVVLNAAAYTHTSVALADAIKGAQVPVVEVHISNVHEREPFRHHSYISPVARGIIVGLGVKGYLLAIQALAN